MTSFGMSCARGKTAAQNSRIAQTKTRCFRQFPGSILSAPERVEDESYADA